MLSGNELVAEGLGLFWEVLEAVGLAGGGGFEGFGFVVGLAAGDHAVEDAGEFASHRPMVPTRAGQFGQQCFLRSGVVSVKCFYSNAASALPFPQGALA